MSPNQNPDFWRSQGGPPSSPNAPKAPINPPNAPSKSDDNDAPGGKNPLSPVKPGDAAAPKGKDARGVNVPSSKPKIAASGAGDPASATKGNQNTPVPSSKTPPSGSGTGNTAADKAKNLGQDISSGGKEFLNRKIDSIGTKKPDPLNDPNRIAPKTGVGRDAEMGKEAIKGAAGGALKGAAKGAVTGGLHGAAAGATKEGIVKAADRINATNARQRADQNKGTSYRDSLIDKASSSSSLDKSRAEMSHKFGGGGAAGAGGAGKSSTAPTPQEVASVAKAASTVAERLTVRTVQTAGISMLVVLGLFFAMISAVTGAVAPIGAATAVYKAGEATCEAPKDTTTVASPGEHGSEEGLKPAAIKVMRYVNAQWGGRIENIGGVRNDQDHATGNAIDVMIPEYTTEAGKKLGHEIADYFVANADKYGISYMIYDDKFWNNSGGQSWTYSKNGQTYGPTEWAPYIKSPGQGDDDNQKHLNHVHISTKDNPGEALDAPKTTTASFSIPGSSVVITRASSVTSVVPAAVPAIVPAASPADYGLATEEQVANAKIIIGMSKTLGLGKEGALVGITVALDESTLKNLDYGDRDSIGLFQQRPSMAWGSKADIMNPAYSAQAFYLGAGTNPGLTSVPDWKSLPVQVAAQRVQKSGTPDGSNYAKDVPQATQVVEALYESSPNTPIVIGGLVNPPSGAINTETSTSCSTTAGTITAGATAAGDTYPAKNESYCRSSACYAEQAADSVSGGGYRGECVDWAGWKLLEGTGSYGSYRVAAMGNAGSWGDAAQAKGIKVDMSPVAGDAIYWLPGKGGSGEAGHIGTVQAVNGDGTVTIEEYNYGTAFPGDTPATGGGRYHTRTIPASDASGYIHFLDPKKSKEENQANLIAKGVLVKGTTTWPRVNA